MSRLQPPPRSTSALAASAAAPLTPTVASPTLVAKAAIRRLVVERLEPTPENYARAYWQEAGVEPPQPSNPVTMPGLLNQPADAPVTPAGPGGRDWSGLIDRMARGLQTPDRYWTPARKRNSLQHVLRGSDADVGRLHQRLAQLVGSWERAPEGPDAGVEPLGTDGADTRPGRTPLPGVADDQRSITLPPAAGLPSTVRGAVRAMWAALDATMAAMEYPDLAGRRVVERVHAIAPRLADGAEPTAKDEIWAEMASVADDARRLLVRREQLIRQLTELVRRLTDGLTAFADEEGWIDGQVQVIRNQLEQGVTVRTVRVVADVMHDTLQRQHGLMSQRREATQALRDLIGTLLGRLGELGGHTGRFEANLDGYAGRIAAADSLESLTTVVGELVGETRQVREQVAATTEQLREEESQAQDLQARVRALESELARLSREVTTDQLTEVMNRRGLQQAFEMEQARAQRGGHVLTVALLDIDDFKKLNDRLGHQAGDEALRFLAGSVQEALRPTDTVARYGGEEFVVLLPQTPLPDAQRILTRLQRQLSASLFESHAGTAFVTFSAGATAHHPGERLEEALERADEALYEAKRTGKNRTCISP